MPHTFQITLPDLPELKRVFGMTNEPDGKPGPTSEIVWADLRGQTLRIHWGPGSKDEVHLAAQHGNATYCIPAALFRPNQP
jgi:hypothetical protein